MNEEHAKHECSCSPQRITFCLLLNFLLRFDHSSTSGGLLPTLKDNREFHLNYNMFYSAMYFNGRIKDRRS